MAAEVSKSWQRNPQSWLEILGAQGLWTKREPTWDWHRHESAVLLLGLFVAVTSDPVRGNCLAFTVFTHEIRVRKDFPNGKLRRASAFQRYIWDSIIYSPVADCISSKNSPVDQRMGILLLIKKPKHKTLRYKIKWNKINTNSCIFRWEKNNLIFLINKMQNK